MKARVVETLAYPRRLMQGSINLDACTHAGHYARRDYRCQTCDHQPECHWLSGHDEHVDLAHKSVEQLTDALEICYAYVDARVTLNGHDQLRCRCAACEWLRDAERLLETLR
jgi:hypothetical protein